ncbi:MAG: nuclear transport factor 2 family protein [Rhodoferax sp.]|uniref:nuclear transport factor 2 family protein n=1 Tax=Rhodoferax sp. TaxID=50421 RepID=UPI0014014478|nr:nuclear transport factor 2 family protein [Rhodoferax sp.]NDP40987.1 nuclear transport factor 2 family protein [Rhodoferax sp.]
MSTSTAAKSLANGPADLEATVARVVVFFESLTPASVADLGAFYDAQARFKDPFNEVQGVTAIRAIFEHMFVALQAPRFVVTGQVLQGRQCFLTWEFRFAFKAFKPDSGQVIRGASQLVFSAQGLITLHRDYWDAAEEFYEKLPFLGSLMRWLKKRAKA